MTQTTLIRRVGQEDLPFLLSWRNDPSVRRFMRNRHRITFEEHSRWFSQADSDATQRLLIVENAGEPIGFVKFTNAEPRGVADWGFYAKPNGVKGNGRILGTMALSYAFTELNLHKVCGQVISANQRSISFHKRLGFAEEGTLREQWLIEREYHSLVCFGILRKEWSSE